MLSVILLFILSLIAIVVSPRFKRVSKVQHPPGPPRLPLIGNLHQFDSNDTPVYLWRLSKTYGPIVSLKLGSVHTLVISSARLGKEVMKTKDAIFASRPTLTGQQKLSYGGLDMAFSPLNDYWREIRKICVLHLFGPKQVQSAHPIRIDEISRAIERVSTLSSLDQVVNLSTIMMSLASNFITRVAFGKRYDDGGSEKSKFDELLKESQALLSAFYVSDYFPSLGWIDRLTGLSWRLESIFKELDSFYQELIHEHLRPGRPKSMEGDILDILLRFKREGSSPVDLTLNHIKAVLMNTPMSFCPRDSWKVRLISKGRILGSFRLDQAEGCALECPWELQLWSLHLPICCTLSIGNCLLEWRRMISTPIVYQELPFTRRTPFAF